jgi:hypothetical protein
VAYIIDTVDIVADEEMKDGGTVTKLVGTSQESHAAQILRLVNGRN